LYTMTHGKLSRSEKSYSNEQQQTGKQKTA